MVTIEKGVYYRAYNMKLKLTDIQRKTLDGLCEDYRQYVNGLIKSAVENRPSPERLDFPDSVIRSAQKDAQRHVTALLSGRFIKGKGRYIFHPYYSYLPEGSQDLMISQRGGLVGIVKRRPSLLILTACIPRHYPAGGKPYRVVVYTRDGDYFVHVEMSVRADVSQETGVMGIDIGKKVPAVCVTGDGAVKFIGSGRERRDRSRRVSTAPALDRDAARKHLENWFVEQDRKDARECVAFAIRNKVGTIYMEDLRRLQAGTDQKFWSYLRLMRFICEAAAPHGIVVRIVEPAYTSQTCPVCGARNKADDRAYPCRSCGYSCHRDLIGARNILKSGLSGRSEVSRYAIKVERKNGK